MSDSLYFSYAAGIAAVFKAIIVSVIAHRQKFSLAFPPFKNGSLMFEDKIAIKFFLLAENFELK